MDKCNLDGHLSAAVIPAKALGNQSDGMHGMV